jgi:hypothetical protein
VRTRFFTLQVVTRVENALNKAYDQLHRPADEFMFTFSVWLALARTIKHKKGHAISSEVCLAIWLMLDEDGDGSLSREEFYDICKYLVMEVRVTGVLAYTPVTIYAHIYIHTYIFTCIDRSGAPRNSGGGCIS